MTLLSNLPKNFPAANSNANSKNRFFFDRDPKYFEIILDFIRDPDTSLIDTKDASFTETLMEEARFYKIYNFVDYIQNVMLKSTNKLDTGIFIFIYHSQFSNINDLIDFQIATNQFNF